MGGFVCAPAPPPLPRLPAPLNNTSPSIHHFIQSRCLKPHILRRPRGKSVCYKLTTAGHHPRRPGNWTQALHSPSRILSLLGPVTVPGHAACSSWDHSLQFLVFLSVRQRSAVFRIILLHIVRGEPANLERGEKGVRAVSTLFLDRPGKFPPTSGPLHLPSLPPLKICPPTHTRLTPPNSYSSYSHITFSIRTSLPPF